MSIFVNSDADHWYSTGWVKIFASYPLKECISRRDQQLGSYHSLHFQTSKVSKEEFRAELSEHMAFQRWVMGRYRGRRLGFGLRAHLT